MSASPAETRLYWTFRALRPHQWLKNLILFVPLLAAHRAGDPSSLLQAFVAFAAFCAIASAAYVINDLADVANDRQHPTKKFRPFAAGKLSIAWGWSLVPLLLLSGSGLSIGFLPGSFTAVVLAYFLITLAYSLKLKEMAMVDVMLLAGLYALRLAAGASAVRVPLSFWLLAFALFLFLSLAFIKRYSELWRYRSDGRDEKLRGRGYDQQDMGLVSTMGIAAGYLSVLILALYIQDAHTAILYPNPRFIWLACPLMLYWISRLWLLAHRGRVMEDPVVFTIKDRATWLVGTLIVAIFLLAKWAH